MSANISEATDLAGQKPDTVAALQKRLDAWDAELVAPKWESPRPAKK